MANVDWTHQVITFKASGREILLFLGFIESFSILKESTHVLSTINNREYILDSKLWGELQEIWLLYLRGGPSDHEKTQEGRREDLYRYLLNTGFKLPEGFSSERILNLSVGYVSPNNVRSYVTFSLEQDDAKD